MKLIHLSDLHLGKRVNEFSMLQDQKYILEQILQIIDAEAPDAVLVAGDVYDRSVPSAEAMELCDWFLVELARRQVPVFLSSGNHDSAERLAFGRQLMDVTGIHICPVYDGTVAPFTLTDEHGQVDIYMLPFVKPATVRHYFPEAQIDTYTDAVRVALEQIDPVPGRRKVLLAHQFITNAATCESEERSVGGLDDVDASVFQGFDYVALGHLHRPQNVTDRIRYCGTPLKYSFSEVNDQKSVTVAELDGAGALTIREVPLTPLRDMIQLTGTFQELTAKEFYQGKGYENTYVGITLTDEDELPDVLGRLRLVYPLMLQMKFDNTRTRSLCAVGTNVSLQPQSPMQVFSELFQEQNGQPMTQEQTDFMLELIQKIWEVNA